MAMTEITLLNEHKLHINENAITVLNHEVIEQTDRYFVKVGVDLFDITKVSYDKLLTNGTIGDRVKKAVAEATMKNNK